MSHKLSLSRAHPTQHQPARPGTHARPCVWLRDRLRDSHTAAAAGRAHSTNTPQCTAPRHSSQRGPHGQVLNMPPAQPPAEAHTAAGSRRVHMSTRVATHSAQTGAGDPASHTLLYS